jgi:GNAT superfamily N-acetyltransferase
LNGISIRPAKEEDVSGIAEISIQAFRGHGGSIEAAERWVRCWMGAYPAYQYWVAESGGRVAGFISWRSEGAFMRPEPVIELDQLAVHSDFRNQGIGGKLIGQSLDEFLAWIQGNNPRLGNQVTAVVWVYALNPGAIKTYSAAHFLEVSGYRDQYGAGEIMMIRRVPVVAVPPRTE